MKKLMTLLCSLFVGQAIAATAPETAYSLSQEGKAVLVDVREENEVKEGMVKGAVWYPLSKMKNDKNWKNEFTQLVGPKQIFLYCRSGRRSGEAMKILNENGLKSENIGGYETLKTELPVTKK